MNKMALGIFLSVLFLASCREDEAKRAAPKTEAATQSHTAPTLDLLVGLPAALRAQAHGPTSRDLESAIAALPLRWPGLVGLAYEAEPTSSFVEDGRPSARGRALLAGLEALNEHGLHPRQFQRDAILGLTTQTAEFSFPSLDPTPEERETLVNWSRSHLDADSDALADAIMAPQSLWPRVRDLVTAYQAARASYATVDLRLELLFADAFLSFSHDMKYRNLSDESDARRLALGDERIRRQQMMSSLAEIRSSDDVDASMRSLWPKNPQYARLMKALAAYQAIASQGEWPIMQPKGRKLPLARGDQGADVETLQKRLAMEGYYEGPVDGQFSGQLRDAVKTYQNTHQLKDDGMIEQEEVDSLNRSVAQRPAQIEVTLDRWRDSRVGVDPYYIHVVIPDFYAELVRDGEVTYRFKVIVGNTQRYLSEVREEEVFFNSTPQISEYMDFVIFNPYWNVTPRVLRELEQNLKEDPNWFKNNGYEVSNEGGSRKVRQRPGQDNALGQVKFQFPNPYDIYMHDTPRRFMFKHEMRAFSHGCVRVDEPLELAYQLFRNEGRSSPRAQITSHLEGGDEDWTELREPVPVHIEYYTVRVDDQGAVHFNADVYRLDKPLVDARMGLQDEDS